MLRCLFVDMNAYFASVEQQVRPELRGKPVAVVAVETDSTSCLAASYEAKRFGLSTGTGVGKARHLCPGLQIVLARPPLYVEFHHRIIEVVENHLHVDKVLSIDEVACRLPSNLNGAASARQIALAIKESLSRKIGPYIRCSIGIAPNQFLAKVASDMQKPNGLTILPLNELPERLFPLAMRDLPGVGHNMHVRLAAHGIDTVRTLWERSADDLARAWGGIEGRKFWQNLHGEDVVQKPTQRRSISHSHVLPPELRTAEGAHAVLVRLIHKAAARMRNLGYAAQHISLHVRYTDHTGWEKHAGIEDAQDTQTLIEAVNRLWNRRAPGTPKKVGIALFDLEQVRNLTLPLFPLDARRLELARAMDHINGRFGRQMLYFGEMHGTRGRAKLAIAFNSVPDENW